jgi:hypothetical protein
MADTKIEHFNNWPNDLGVCLLGVSSVLLILTSFAVRN